MPGSTPIYTALQQYAGKDFLRLHMPGHVGKGIKQHELCRLAVLDLTEIPGLDDLHLPTGVIKESQELLARAFGAVKSYFLVNGATSGIHTLFLALNQEGSKVLLPRNAHRSFYGGLVLSGATPVYIPVQVEAELGIALTVTAEDVNRLLILNPEVNNVFISSPSYYGTGSDIEAIASITISHNKLLLVDEAHGAHFTFSRHYPQTALESGADGVINGLHKTLPVLNQGASLHLSARLAGDSRIVKSLSLLTTTSPSYPILASIELARQFMEKNGESILEKSYQLSQEYRQKINAITGLNCCEQELQAVTGVTVLDPLKMLVSVRGSSLDGYQFAALLRERYGIQVELEGTNFILAMFSLFHDRNDWEKFYQALQVIAATYPGRRKTWPKVKMPPMPSRMLTPRQAFMALSHQVPIKDALNRVAAELITVYPPGIPCILPGELIDQEMMDYIIYLRKSGARLQGPQDPSLQYINVIRE